MKARLHSIASSLLTYEQFLHLTSLACCSAAVVASGALPAKLNHIIQPLMAALRKEPEPELQVGSRSVSDDLDAMHITKIYHFTPTHHHFLMFRKKSWFCCIFFSCVKKWFEALRTNWYFSL